MRTRRALLVVLAAAVTLTSVAAAGPGAAKQRVAFTSELARKKTFVLTTFSAGALQRDTGTVFVVSGNSRQVIRDGQKVGIFPHATYTFTGTQGALIIRERTEWVEVSDRNTSYGYPPAVAIGTWKVVRGTGQYAGVTGSGRSGHAGLGRPWLARHQGFLTTP
jgi:hypothetical protein